MRKEISEVETIMPANNQGRREIIVVETTDNVRYIFDNWFDQDGAVFSHRYYPNREPNEHYQPENYRLPKVVEDKIRKRVGSISMMDGMIKEARQNKQAVGKFKAV